jgi:hypothetical protein
MLGAGILLVPASSILHPASFAAGHSNVRNDSWLIVRYIAAVRVLVRVFEFFL